MKIKLKILIPALLSILSIGMRAQQQNPSGFYAGAQVNSPLFWGDFFSFGEETRLGFGGGLFAGYTLYGWLSPELSFDYGVGRIGPQDHQMNDYVSKSGIINYVQSNPSDMKLGGLYGRTTYMQVGLRLQAGLLSMLSHGTYRTFDVELAPAIYAQKFSPKLYTVADDEQWSEGTGGGWNCAVGGDLGVRYRFTPQLSGHVRGGLFWLNKGTFDGLDNDPVWRVNLMVNASIGITINL